MASFSEPYLKTMPMKPCVTDAFSWSSVASPNGCSTRPASFAAFFCSSSLASMRLKSNFPPLAALYSPRRSRRSRTKASSLGKPFVTYTSHFISCFMLRRRFPLPFERVKRSFLVTSIRL